MHYEYSIETPEGKFKTYRWAQHSQAVADRQRRQAAGENPAGEIYKVNRPWQSRSLTIRDRHSFRDVYRRLRRVLEREELIDEYFSLQSDHREPPHGNRKWNELVRDYRWIACYAVTGGSEGHYVHVELIGYDQAERRPKICQLMLAKTFQGMEHALKIAGRLSVLLGA